MSFPFSRSSSSDWTFPPGTFASAVARAVGMSIFASAARAESADAFARVFVCRRAVAASAVIVNATQPITRQAIFTRFMSSPFAAAVRPSPGPERHSGTDEYGVVVVVAEAQGEESARRGTETETDRS